MADFFMENKTDLRDALQPSRSEKEQKKFGSIWQLPPNLQVSFLKKCDAPSMSRLRRASKALGSVVQENDVKIRSSQTFVITVNRPSRIVGPKISFWVTPEELLNNDGSEKTDKDIRILKAIEDPMKQLDGFSFSCVLVNFECRIHYTVPPDPIWTHFIANTLPILRNLCTSCEFLYFKNTLDLDISSVLPHISFSSLTVGKCFLPPTSMNWNINDGNILNITHLQLVDLPMAFPAFRQFRKIFVCIWARPSFYCKIEWNLKQILKEISERPIGNMRVFRMTFIGTRWLYMDVEDYKENKAKEREEMPNQNENEDSSDDDHDEERDPWNISRFPCAITLRSKISRGQSGSKYYKIVLDGGQAIVAQSSRLLQDQKETEFTFYFFANYSKRDLFEVCFKETFGGSSDLVTAMESSIYQGFLDTETERDAVHYFFVYLNDLRKWIKYHNFVEPEYSDDDPMEGQAKRRRT